MAQFALRIAAPPTAMHVAVFGMGLQMLERQA